jgi:hypothetical protein
MVVILGLVEFAKRLGVTGKWSLGLSMLLGLLLGAAYQAAANGWPVDFAGWFGLALFGIVLGLSASGLYDLGGRLLGIRVTVAAEAVDDTAPVQ